MRLFYVLTVAAAVLLLAGCVDVRYVGDVYPPTQSVRFYMNEKDVPANTYREMGAVTVAINDDDAAFRSGNVLSDAIREKAMEVGADAVVIISNERYKIGTRHSSDSNTYYSEREKGKVRRHHRSAQYRKRTQGYADTYTSSQSYDLHRDEVRARFLKRKSAN